LTGRGRRLVNPFCGCWITSGDTACPTAENGRITRICAILNLDARPLELGAQRLGHRDEVGQLA
jgi:hypothetical protein